MVIKKLGIGKTLILSFTLIIIFFMSSMIVTYVNLSKANENAEYINKKSLPMALLTNEMLSNIVDVHQWILDISTTRDRDGFSEAEFFKRKFKENVTQFKEFFKKGNDQRSLKLIDEMDLEFDEFFESGKVMANAYIDEGLTEGKKMMEAFDKSFDALSFRGKSFHESRVKEIKGMTGSIQKYMISVLSVLALLGGLTIVFSILVALGLSRSIIKGFNSIDESIEMITISSKEVSQSSLTVSQGTTEQASATEQISSSIGELTSQTKNSALNSKKARDLSNDTMKSAREGEVFMRELLTSIDEISNSSQKISKIIKTIEEIAFQTNLLALNAAVEAARAGSKGKGFAVVAEEVNNLSKRSSQAANETADIIQESIKRIKDGLEIAGKTEESFNKIVEAIANVSELTIEISVSSEEQVKGIEQVEVGIQQIDQVTQGNASLAEENASASETLTAQAAKMQGVVAGFLAKKSYHSTNRKPPVSITLGETGDRDKERKILKPADISDLFLRSERRENPDKLIALNESGNDFEKY